MDKNGTLTISNFQAGVADSPLLGFSKLNNVEIFEKPGVAKLQFASSNSYNTLSLPIAMCYDSLGNQYVGCLGGHFYKNGSLIDTNTGGITDIAIVSDGVKDPNGTYPIEYVLITRRGGVFQFYGPTYSLSAAILNGRADLANGHWKKIVVGLDTSSNNTPYIYITNGNKISALSNFTNAAVGSPPTYNWNATALTLQPGHYAITMGELGKYLAIGTMGDASGFISIFNTGQTLNKRCSLVLWDRTSPTFQIPILFRENGLTQILQIQNLLYLGIGNRGRILYTNGTNVTQAKRIPFCFNRQFGSLAINYPNAVTLHNGELVWGVSTQGGSGDLNGNYGVYTMSLVPSVIDGNEISFPVHLRNTISTGSTGTSQSQPMQIGVLYSNGQDVLNIGWQDGSTYGVDTITYNKCTNFISVIESQYYTVGTELNKKTFKRLELSLTAPLTGTQQIRVSYRENLNDTTWTVLGTYTATDFGANNVHNDKANLVAKTKLQFKIEMTQSTSEDISKNIELESLTFY